MDPAWIRIIESLNQRAMQHYGYAPAKLSPEPGHLQRFAAVLADLPGLGAAIYRLYALKFKLDRHFQNKQQLDPQQGMEENLRLNPAAWRYYPEFAIPSVPQLAAEGTN